MAPVLTQALHGLPKLDLLKVSLSKMGPFTYVIVGFADRNNDHERPHTIQPLILEKTGK